MNLEVNMVSKYTSQSYFVFIDGKTIIVGHSDGFSRLQCRTFAEALRESLVRISDALMGGYELADLESAFELQHIYDMLETLNG